MASQVRNEYEQWVQASFVPGMERHIIVQKRAPK
jgi:hypothetical protein